MGGSRDAASLGGLDRALGGCQESGQRWLRDDGASREGFNACDYGVRELGGTGNGKLTQTEERSLCGCQLSWLILLRDRRDCISEGIASSCTRACMWHAERVVVGLQHLASP